MSDAVDITTDKELDILEQISESAEREQVVHQRDLARIIGMSLGMTNAILKRLSHKGFLTVRKVNNRNIAYAVTPAGVEAIARRSYRYLRRTVRNIVLYKEAIEAFIIERKREGYRALQLVGESDLAFIVEHFAGKYGLRFSASADARGSAQRESAPRERQDGCFVLYAESIEPEPEAAGDALAAYLGRILADRL